MRLIDLNLLDYRAAWTRQEEVHAEVLAGGEEAILLVEHPPTITLGRRAAVAAEHLKLPRRDSSRTSTSPSSKATAAATSPSTAPASFWPTRSSASPTGR